MTQIKGKYPRGKGAKKFLIFSAKISNFKGEKILLGVGRSLFGYIFCDNLPSET